MRTFQKSSVIAAVCLGFAATVQATDTDIGLQRMALAAAAGYDPASLTIGEIGISQQARGLWNAGQRDQALARLNAWIETYPLSIAGHRMLAQFQRTLAAGADAGGDKTRLEAQAKTNFEIYASLIRSIARDTQCASYEDACKVINIAEENAVIVDTGGKAKLKQSVSRNQGVPFDVVVVRNAAGDERTFYFDISAFYKGL